MGFAMKKMNSDSFITRNGLIALSEAGSANNPSIPLALPKLLDFITASELNEDDFYVNLNHPEKPFCYYRGTVFLEFANTKQDLSNLKKHIINTENQLNKAVAARDFDSFLKIVDPRLAPDLFMEVFSFIPDQDKYPLFKELLDHNRFSREVFDPAFISKATRYKDAHEGMPLADEQGYVKIFASAGRMSELETQALWYTDINRAIQQMISVASRQAELYQARVHISDVKSYSARRFENEVTLEPWQACQIKHLDMIKIAELLPLMQTQGMIGWYFYYARQIKSEWFHNPEGIHALSHTKRVLLLGILLAYLENLSDQERDLICLAAIYHDIGRLTDGYDTTHGIASYRKLVSKGLLTRIPATELETIRFIIELHAVADKAALKQLSKYELPDIDRTLKLYNLFKDADGLDRVRINDLNPDYLRNPGAHKLLLLAHQLYHDADYEKRWLKS